MENFKWFGQEYGSNRDQEAGRVPFIHRPLSEHVWASSRGPSVVSHAAAPVPSPPMNASQGLEFYHTRPSFYGFDDDSYVEYLH